MTKLYLKKWLQVKKLFLPFLVIIIFNLYFFYLSSNYYIIDAKTRIFIFVLINQVYFFMMFFVYIALIDSEEQNRSIEELEYIISHTMKSGKKNKSDNKKE